MPNCMEWSDILGAHVTLMMLHSVFSWVLFEVLVQQLLDLIIEHQHQSPSCAPQHIGPCTLQTHTKSHPSSRIQASASKAYPVHGSTEEVWTCDCQCELDALHRVEGSNFTLKNAAVPSSW